MGFADRQDARRRPADRAPSRTIGSRVAEAARARAPAANEFERFCVPQNPIGVVVAVYRRRRQEDPRTRHLLIHLQDAGLATLLVDPAAAPGPGGRQNALDVAALGRRLLDTTARLHRQPGVAQLPVSLLAGGTGVAAAVWAAAEARTAIAAIVSHGGRPDLAGPRRLAALSAPTLLLVGAHDTAVLDLNRRARSHMRCESRLLAIPGAGHVFEGPRALTVADLTRDWLIGHLAWPRWPRPSDPRW
ncbi:MAG TPA: hypothetical protein VFU73_11345 [Actinocrinis sp.]|nr:hypothetical protein [Actinocrinis sp.]